MGRHARRAPSLIPAAAADRTDIVRGLQSKCGGWLIMWSKWRQTYTAFCGTTAGPLIIDEAEVGRFLNRIRQAEQA